MGVRIGVLDPTAEYGVKWLKNVAFAQDIIHFGTDPALSCFRIHQRADREGVRRRHCTLFFSGGMYRLDFDRGAAVFIDGSATPAPHMCNPFHAKRRIELRLGQPAYRPESRVPTFVIERMDPDAFDVSTLSGQERKDWKKETKRIRNAIDQTEYVQRLFGIRVRHLWFAVAGAAGAGIIGSLLLLINTQTVVARLNVVEQDQNIGTIASQTVKPSVAVLGVVLPSGKFEPVGTGWLCCANLPAGKGGAVHIETPFIVTNIHVTDQIGERLGAIDGTPGAQIQQPGAAANASSSGEKGAAFVARFPPQPGSTTTVDIRIDGSVWVKGVTTNPLSQVFHNTFEADGIKAADLYDVAVVRLSPENKAILKDVPPLKLAQDPATLRVGAPTTVVGFPFEQLALSMSPTAPEAKTFDGAVVRLTDAFAGVRSLSPVQLAGRDARPSPSLIALQAESAGGISGSPVVTFENDGGKRELRVIGMVMNASFLNGANAGAAAFVRIPNSSVVFALDKTSIEDLAIGAKLDDAALRSAELQRWLTEASDSTTAPQVAALNAFQRDVVSDKCTATSSDVSAPVTTIKLDKPVGNANSAEGEGTYTLPQQAGERVLVAVKAGAGASGELRLAFQVAGGQLEKGDHAINAVSWVRQAQRTDQTFNVIVQGPKDASVGIYVARSQCMTRQRPE